MFAATGEHPDFGLWWFIDANSDAGKHAYSVRQHDGRNLIPFAKVDDGRGDIACFDGDDTSASRAGNFHFRTSLILSQPQ